MDEEKLVILVQYIAEAIQKEGPDFSPQSLVSNLRTMSEEFAPDRVPNPTQRYAEATERHIKDVCKQRERMARELAKARESHKLAVQELRRELTVVIESQRGRLEVLTPQHEVLKHSLNGLKSFNTFTFFLLTLGSIFMAVASFIPSDVFKYSALAVGVSATIFGLCTQWFVVHKAPPLEEPAAGREDEAQAVEGASGA